VDFVGERNHRGRSFVRGHPILVVHVCTVFVPNIFEIRRKLVAEFEPIESLGELDWSQKNSVAFKRGGKRQVKFNTKKTQINVSISVQQEILAQIDTDALASDVGVPIDQTSVDAAKKFTRVKLNPEQNADIQVLAQRASEYIA
jgi:hypothetical protein